MAVDISYSISSDCAKVTILVTGIFDISAYTPYVSEYQGEPLAATGSVVDGGLQYTFSPVKDSVYHFSLAVNTGEIGGAIEADGAMEGGDVATEQYIFVSCRSNKCFHKLNNKATEADNLEQLDCGGNWAAKALLRGAVAAFGREEYLLAKRALYALTELCHDCNCDCGC